MREIILKTIISYYLIATFLYVNLLFNPSLKFKITNKKTGEEIKVPNYILAIICFYWIFFLPKSVINQKRSEKNE